MTTILHSLYSFFASLFGFGSNEAVSLGLTSFAFAGVAPRGVNSARSVVLVYGPSHSARHRPELNKRRELAKMRRTRRARGQDVRTGA